MAILTVDQLVAAARQKILITKTSSFTTVAVNPSTTLDVAGQPGAWSLSVGNTSNGLVPTDATAWFPAINAFGGGATGYIADVQYSSSVAWRLFLYDMLFRAGSFVCTSLTTFNLTSQPSYSGRLPNTDYTGLRIFVEINAAMAASATTIAVTYTNEAGTTGRSTWASASLSWFATRRLVELPLQAGDKGVQKIESVIVWGATNASGTVNVIVARPLIYNMRVVLAWDGDIMWFDRTGLPIVYADSALWLVVVPDSTASWKPDVLLTIANW